MFGWSVIGSGAIANTVAHEIVTSGRHRVVSCYSMTYSRCVKFAKQYHAKACTSFDEAVLSDGVDGVYIATPHTCHIEYAVRALELGVPVLIEKPIAMNSSELGVLTNMDRAVYVSEAMWTRYNPITLKIREIVRSGALGDIDSVHASFKYPYHLSGFSDRVVKREAGGGALLDIGVYLVSYMDMLFGEPDTIHAESRIGKCGTDIATTMRLGYHSHGTFNATLSVALDRLSLCSMTIRAENGTIRMPLFYRPTHAYINIGGKQEILRCKAGYIHEFDRVASDIRAGKMESDLITLDDSMSVMRTLDRVRSIIGLTYPCDE